MINEAQEHYDKYIKLIKTANEQIVKILPEDDGYYFLRDTLFGVITAKKCLSISDGFLYAIEQKNSHCATVLLKAQLEVMLYFYAAFFVDCQESFIGQVLIKGTAVKNLLSNENKKMTDNYLVDRLSRENQWAYKIYKQAFNCINVSDRRTTIDVVQEVNYDYQYRAVSNDPYRDISEYFEQMECFYKVTNAIRAAILNWF